MTAKPRNETGASEPLGRRARKALAVRQALFESGLAAFELQPIGLVSILDITEAADVAKGVFYLQFKSKDDYLKGAIKSSCTPKRRDGKRVVAYQALHMTATLGRRKRMNF